MQDSPTAHELISVVAHFLGTELAPSLQDPRQKFRALVAANVLQIVAREMALGKELTRAEWQRLVNLTPDPSPEMSGENLQAEIDGMTRALCAQIRAGDADDGEFREAVFSHIRQTVIEKLQVANPKFLERAGTENANLRESLRI